MIRALCLFFSLLLAACANFQPGVNAAGQLQPPPGMGYAVVGVTLHSFDDVNGWPMAALEFTGPAGRRELWSNTQTAGIVAPGDEPNGNGMLQVVALPPGEYRTTRMLGQWTLEIAGWRQRQFVQVPLPARFSVRAGEVVYLGDTHIRLDFQPEVRLEAKPVRDFNHMRVRWGVTDTSTIRMAPLQLDAVP